MLLGTFMVRPFCPEAGLGCAGVSRIFTGSARPRHYGAYRIPAKGASLKTGQKLTAT